MANLCLPRQVRDKLLGALKSKDISIEKLYNMSDTERHTIFKQYVGEDFAKFVNSEFEKAMLSNQKKSISNWIEKLATVKEPVRKDLLKKVEKLGKILTPDEEFGFLNDLAETKLGIGVSEEEASTILKLKSEIDDLKVKIPENSPVGSEERLAYGLAVDDFKQFVGNLKNEANALSLKEYSQPKNWGKAVIDAAGLLKSTVATLDNSFIGRQGIKTLLSGNYKLWADSALQSFKNFGEELVQKSNGFFKERNDAIMRGIRADVYSRPNALNGKYNAAKNGYGLGLLHEEAFPSSIPERIPLLGRLFKASETAFNGSAMKMRADLADAVIAAAEQNGVDMLDPAQATAHGKFVSAMTGRGDLGKAETIAKEANALMFSIKFLKSNFDTLTAHYFDKTMTPEAKKTAALATAKIAAHIGAILGIAKMINPDSVDFDPRSTRFGQIKIGQHSYDITGGMRGLVTLGSRIVPTYHNGEWGFWTKSASTGKYTKMSLGDFGEQTALDTFEQFFEGKLSPTAGAVRDIWKGQNFEGEKPDFVNTLIGLTVPISATTLVDELKKGNDDVLMAMLAEGLGFSATDNTFRGSGKKWAELKEKKGEDVYNQSLKKVTEEFNKEAEKLQNSARFKNMKNEDQAKMLDNLRTEVTNKIFKRYGIGN